MREIPIVVGLALILAGCASDPATTTVTEPGVAPSLPVTTPTAATPGSAPATPAEESRELKLYFAPGYQLSEQLPSEATEPERLDPAAFYAFQAGQEGSWSPWASVPSARAREITGTVEVQLRITASAAAHQTTPKAADFPGAGGWIGPAGGRNHFFLMQDAPERLEAGVVHKASASITLPKGGLFLLPQEPLSPHLWTAYKTADNTPVHYVLGGDDPAYVKAMVREFDLPAVTPVEILSEAGEMGPHPGFATAGNPDAAEFPLKLPPGTVYVIVETAGGPKVAGHVDIDFDVVKGGEVVIGGHGPTTHEIAVVGPGNIAAYGSDLAVRVSASSVGGNTWTLKATAYVANV